MASPMTPPSPLGSGQCGLAGRQEARPAAKTEPASQNARRIHSRSNGRWVAMRQPQTATGSTNTVAARPNNCIRRSAPMAPGVPRKLRTGPSMAWLSDGSCTDQAASATPISDANVALAGVAAVGAVAREVVAGNDAKPAVAPEFHGCGFIAALLAHIEPEEEAAGRPLVAVAAADDLVGKIELRDIELAVLIDMRLVAVGRGSD